MNILLFLRILYSSQNDTSSFDYCVYVEPDDVSETNMVVGKLNMTLNQEL